MFYLLQMVTSFVCHDYDLSTAMKSFNAIKNRSTDILPGAL